MDAKGEKGPDRTPSGSEEPGLQIVDGELVNASGHVQEMDRSFGFWSICAMAVLTDNAWAAGGGTLVVALYNGGGPGVMYGLIAATFFYIFITASLAELASAIPSSANVYHWASVTAGPRFGPLVSFFAGWFNALAWTFGTAAVLVPASNSVMAMWQIHHPGFEVENWMVFIVYLILTLIITSLVVFGQRLLARLTNVFGTLCLLSMFVSTMVCAIMPSTTDAGYASNAFVWTEWENLAGYSSNGFVFLLGMLNGAFAIGTPDGVSHLCEEIPNPRRNIPLGMIAQMTTGFITTFAYYTSLLYAITDLSVVQSGEISALPLASIYQQATRSNAGTTGLLFIFFLDIIVGAVGAAIAAGRMTWTLARDDAMPLSGSMRKVSGRWRNPFNAQIFVACIIIALGLIYIGSSAAFAAFAGVFVIFTTLSYLCAILPHLLTRRRYVKPGLFWMPSAVAYPCMIIACAYIIVFDVIYMFPYSMPLILDLSMNWSCVMVGGIFLLLLPWYFYKRRHGYEGPNVLQDAHDDVLTGIVGLSKVEEEEARRRASNFAHE